MKLFNAACMALELAVSELRPGLTAAARTTEFTAASAVLASTTATTLATASAPPCAEHPRIAENETEVPRPAWS